MRSALWLVLLLAVGCTAPNPKSCLDHHCSDPALPFCDEDGSIGGTAGTCIAVDCTANTFQECRGNLALTCNATGDDYTMIDCPYGCGAGGCLPCTGDCEKRIIPRYLPAVCDQLTTLPAISISQDTVIDTSIASACSAIVPQQSGPEICVLRGSAITIQSQKTLKIQGTRVFALVGDRDVVVTGILDVSADATTNGPGGGFESSGAGAGGTGSVGGGGAGHHGAGGSGANGTGAGGAGNGGAAVPSPASRVSLFGGPQPSKAAHDAAPGGGGGGVIVVSCRGRVSVPGIIDAGGGGGGGDSLLVVAGVPTSYTASGGGAGGTVVLQGIDVTVEGEIYTNGGGGGGGGGPGNIGSDGLRSFVQAQGALPGGLSNTGGAGGNGGSAMGDAGAGLRPAGASSCGTGCGAGGASAGFVLTATGGNPRTIPSTAKISPSLEPNLTVPTN